jgi:hypothetical protein
MSKQDLDHPNIRCNRKRRTSSASAVLGERPRKVAKSLTRRT